MHLRRSHPPRHTGPYSLSRSPLYPHSPVACTSPASLALVHLPACTIYECMYDSISCDESKSHKCAKVCPRLISSHPTQLSIIYRFSHTSLNHRYQYHTSLLDWHFPSRRVYPRVHKLVNETHVAIGCNRDQSSTFVPQASQQ